MADAAPAPAPVSPFPAVAVPFATTGNQNPDVQRIAALTQIVKNKKAQIIANAKVVTPQVLDRFKAQLTHAQGELDATVAKVKADTVAAKT